MTTRISNVCEPIHLDHHYYIPQPVLVKLNQESIRLGFSRNLIVGRIKRLPSRLKFPILGVWDHTSGEGLKNIRLEVLVGPNADDLHYCTLDVTHDAWASIQKRFSSVRCRRR